MATRSIVPRADGEGSIGTEAKKWGILHAKNILTTDAASHNSIYRGAEITDSWATIQANIQAGDFSNYYIGDWKQITLTTDETVIMEIAGINCYKNWGSTAIGNHIDFISRDCLSATYSVNSTATNNGSSSVRSPWGNSDLTNSLNDASVGVMSTLPSALRSAISYKLTYVEERYSSGGTVGADTGASFLNMVLWIPAEVEVFGHATWSEIGYGTAGFVQYPIFRLNPSKIVKGAGNGNGRTTWWEMSAETNSSSYFCCVSAYGEATSHKASDNYIRTPLCFRIA